MMLEEHHKEIFNMTIDNFSLPVPQWYDNEKRIYKDRLIENFNAIEAKLLEISKLDAFRVDPPDFSTIDIPNVTLDSPDDSIINLRSLLVLLTGNTLAYPLSCEFEGTLLKQVSFFSFPDYRYVIKTDIETNANATNRYVFMDFTTGNISVSSDPARPENRRLIGVFCKDRVIGIYDDTFIGINILELLAKMKTGVYTFDSHGTVSGGANIHCGSNGRAVAWIVRESKGGSNYVVTRDAGL